MDDGTPRRTSRDIDSRLSECSNRISSILDRMRFRNPSPPNLRRTSSSDTVSSDDSVGSTRDAEINLRLARLRREQDEKILNLETTLARVRSRHEVERAETRLRSMDDRGNGRSRVRIASPPTDCREASTSTRVPAGASRQIHLPRPEIPKFYGDSMQFKSFIKSFKKHIAELLVDDDIRLCYLLQHCGGEALELIDHCSMLSDGYQQALSELENEYGKDRIISRDCLKQLKVGPQIRTRDSKELAAFARLLRKCGLVLGGSHALRRFIGRRGRPVQIVCDNGTNLVEASRELKRSLSEWNRQKIWTCLHQRDIEFSFNPPYASHVGGVFERMIRSTKRILIALLTGQTLTFQKLETLLVEVEGILNSRPIAPLTMGPNGEEPMTPNHLLILRSSTHVSPGIFEKRDCFLKRWRQMQYLADEFCRRWLREFLPTLTQRTKWHQKCENFKTDDVVLLVEDSVPRARWILGQVLDTFSDKQGLVRSVLVKTPASVV